MELEDSVWGPGSSRGVTFTRAWGLSALTEGDNTYLTSYKKTNSDNKEFLYSLVMQAEICTGESRRGIYFKIFWGKERGRDGRLAKF